MGRGNSTYVVAVGVLDKSKGIECDLVHKLDTLVLSSMINAALKHTAAMPVSGDLDAVLRNSIIDELHEVSISRRKNGY